MNILEEFKKSIKKDEPPCYADEYLMSLWYEKKGDWDKAHSIAQEIYNENGSWIHAYLHRVEGDLSNARYWYSMAGKKMPKYSTEEEWKKITEYFLNT